MLGRVWLAVLVFGGGALFAACGGAADNDPTRSAGRVGPGQECDEIGAKAPADDGCNTCNCTEAGWACTEMACGVPCQDGATKPSGDGCNSCTCKGGEWGCTNLACEYDAGASCPPPRADAPGSVCAQVAVYARSPDSGACCMYGTPCLAPVGWQTFGSERECLGSASCVPGQTREDGCNTCTCSTDGDWACTDRACIDAGVACGARAGDTCAPDEYCAYLEGAYCGAADAEATCQKRPEACDMISDPVCGCDGQTHGNACVAAMAGTGVMHAGPCPTT